MNNDNPTAAVILIGNELLSGRTQDTNLNYIAKGLTEIGVRLAEARVIPDIEDTIINVVNELRARHTYVFTTGGIGPTHDDITAASIAKAFGVPFSRHPEAERILLDYYGDKITEARLRMANTPEGAELIANPVSKAPGFKIGNVYVMAGVPSIMQAMFDGVKPALKGGIPILSYVVSSFTPESQIALELEAIQQHNPEVEIGSYPFMKQGRVGVSIVTRGFSEEVILKVSAEVKSLFTAKSGEVIEEGWV